MKLTKLSAAWLPGWTCRLMPAPARMGAGTASQLIPGVRLTPEDRAPTTIGSADGPPLALRVRPRSFAVHAGLACPMACLGGQVARRRASLIGECAFEGAAVVPVMWSQEAFSSQAARPSRLVRQVHVARPDEPCGFAGTHGWRRIACVGSSRDRTATKRTLGTCVRRSRTRG
jgi:hypothetical protein